MKGFVSKLLLVVLSAGCALAFVEVALRIAYPQQLGVWYSLRSGMVIHPPNVRIYLPRFGHEVSFNSLGMRDVEPRASKEPDALRVLVLGDSFMEALQVPLEASFPRLLERNLRALSGRQIEVISCGVGGWGTDDELQYLREYGLRLQPDVILVAVTLHNDVSDNLRERFHALAGEDVVRRERNEIPEIEFRLLKVKDLLASRSHLTQLLRQYRHRSEIQKSGQQLDTHVLSLFQRNASPVMARGWRLTHGLVREIHREGAKAGARTAVFLIPLALQVYEEHLDGWLVRNGITPEDILLERPQQIMHEFGTAADVAVIDLLPSFRSAADGRPGGLHVPGDGHWNKEGHEIAAMVVARELIERRVLVGQAE